MHECFFRRKYRGEVKEYQRRSVLRADTWDARDNDVDLLGGIAANVGAEHDGILRVAAESLQVTANGSEAVQKLLNKIADDTGGVASAGNSAQRQAN